jgi:hypothetical protein
VRHHVGHCLRTPVLSVVREKCHFIG